MAININNCLLRHNNTLARIYFPLLVPECFPIEPIETEIQEAKDDFVDAVSKILEKLTPTRRPTPRRRSPSPCDDWMR